MSIASIGYGWTILSRALSQSAPRQTAATLVHHCASRSTSKSFDFVSNTTKSNSTTDPSIFEDESEDYANVHATPKAHSTMSRIAAKLPLRLPDPVVSDMSIFEDSTDGASRNEYAVVRVSLRKPPSSTFETLIELIRSKQYEGAWQLCQELLNSDIEIPRSNLYGLAAMDALSSNELSEEEKVARCLLWLKMIPCARENRDAGVEMGGIQRIKVMKRRVFQALQPTMTLALEFSLIMASKGYADIVTPDAVLFVVRFATPPVSLRFVKDFLDFDFIYVADVDSESQETRNEIRLRRLQELAYRVQRPAIETYARSGEFHEAMSLLPTSKDPFRLSTATYDYLLFRLRHARQSYPDYIERVNKLRLDPLYSIDMPVSSSHSQFDELNSKSKYIALLEEELDPQSPVYIGEALAVQLRSILNRIRISKLLVPEVVNFLSDYSASGRITAIYRLRKLALGENWPTGGAFLYAEMSYYLNSGLHLLVLQTYANYFYFSGVPEEEVAAAIYWLDEGDHPAYKVKRSRSFRKWIPTESHTDLAWHALARSAPSGRGIDSLYHRFMEYQLRIRNGNNTPKDATRLCFPPSIQQPVGSSVFTVFMSRLLRPEQPSRAAELFRDMIKVGVNPTIHHYTLLATFYVHARDIERASSLVDLVEQAHPVESPSPMKILEHRQRSGLQLQSEPDIPIPDVIFYTSILSALVELDYISEAQVIRELFFKRFFYEMGLHPPLDYPLTLLRQREGDQKRTRRPVYTPQS